MVAAVLSETNRVYPKSMDDVFPGTDWVLRYMRDVRALCEALQEEA